METSFGDILQQLRKEKNLSQQELADSLFVSRASISNWESNRRLPDLIILSRLAKVLDVDIARLVSGINEEPMPQEVIIVDDEPTLLAGAIPVISEVLPKATITGFTKCAEAISYTEKNRVELAFLDIEIGTESGIELCRRLSEANPRINVIFLTAYPDYAASAWDTAASGFLLKPLHAEDVRTQIKKLRYPIFNKKEP